jgi:hypothetical protein
VKRPALDLLQSALSGGLLKLGERAQPELSVKLNHRHLNQHPVAAPDERVVELTTADFERRTLARPAEQARGEGSPQKPGPQSGAEMVIAAYEELRRTGVVKDGMPISDIHRKLVRLLKPDTKAFPNGRGLSYASIARHLRLHLTGLSKFSS